MNLNLITLIRNLPPLPIYTPTPLKTIFKIIQRGTNFREPLGLATISFPLLLLEVRGQ